MKAKLKSKSIVGRLHDAIIGSTTERRSLCRYFWEAAFCVLTIPITWPILVHNAITHRRWNAEQRFLVAIFTLFASLAMTRLGYIVIPASPFIAWPFIGFVIVLSTLAIVLGLTWAWVEVIEWIKDSAPAWKMRKRMMASIKPGTSLIKNRLAAFITGVCPEIEWVDADE